MFHPIGFCLIIKVEAPPPPPGHAFGDPCVDHDIDLPSRGFSLCANAMWSAGSTWRTRSSGRRGGSRGRRSTARRSSSRRSALIRPMHKSLIPCSARGGLQGARIRRVCGRETDGYLPRGGRCGCGACRTYSARRCCRAGATSGGRGRGGSWRRRTSTSRGSPSSSRSSPLPHFAAAAVPHQGRVRLTLTASRVF
jgi:hypothetical protein